MSNRLNNYRQIVDLPECCGSCKHFSPMEYTYNKPGEPTGPEVCHLTKEWENGTYKYVPVDVLYICDDYKVITGKKH